MEREVLDGNEHAQHPPITTPDVGPDTATSLPGQIGNAAFSKLVSPVSRDATKSQGAGPLDPEIAEDINTQRGGGSPLPEPVQADMESNLGADLSGVRIHTDTKADKLNRSVQAEAFTTGSDVFFKSGKFEPESTDGRRLLAHELTHVVQQSSGSVPGGSRVSDPNESHEVEARAVGDAVAATPAQTVSPSATGGGISRMEEEEELQASPDPTVSRGGEEEEEELQMSADPTVSRMEEEEELQASPDPTVSRQEEEEELQASPDPTVSRQEEEEELQMSADPTVSRQEEEEELMQG